jgi:hypothetical protein
LFFGFWRWGWKPGLCMLYTQSTTELHPSSAIHFNLCSEILGGWGEPKFELRASHLQSRQLYHSSHTSSPFCCGYFGDGGSWEIFAWAGLRPWSSQS